MLQSRSAFRALAKKSDELTIAIVPAGTSFPAGWQDLSILLARQQSLRPIELGPVDPHAMQNDCELARDRDPALRSPLCLTSFNPRPSRWTISGCGSAERRLLQIDNSAAYRIWRFGRTNRPP